MARISTTFQLEDRITATLTKVANTTERVAISSERAAQATETQARASDRAAAAGENLLRVTGELQAKVDNSVTVNNHVKASIEGWDAGVDKLVGSLGALNSRLDQYQTKAQASEQATKRVSPAILQVDHTARMAGNRITNMWDRFKGYLFALFAIQAVSRALRALFSSADEYSNIQSRLNLINDGTQTTAELNEKIYRTAQKTRAEYTTMASSVAKLNMLTNGVFANNNESIRFLELMQKSFTISGASAEEQKSAMLQLTQAMASGRLQGDELRSISENSPMLLQAIEKYAGISRAELRKMAAEGRISAELIKNSLFAAAEDIESKFEQVPMTVGQAWTTFINYLQMRLQPVFQMIQDALRSEEFKQFAAVATQVIDGLVFSVLLLFNILGSVWNAVYSIGSFFASNWSAIGPIVMGIASALAVVYSYMIAMTIVETIRGMWESLNAVVAMFNALVMANPIVMVGVAVVAVIIAIMTGFLGLAQTVEVVFGIIGMVIYGLGAVVYDVFVGIFNIVMTVVEAVVNAFIMGVDFIKLLWWGFLTVIGNIVEMMGNIFIDLINFLLEKWNDFGYAMDNMWYMVGQGVVKMAEAAGGVVDGLINAVLSGIEGMMNSALSGINAMIETVNKIPGVNIGTLGEVSLDKSNISGAAKAWGDSMAAPVKQAATKLEHLSGIAKGLAGEAPTKSELWTAPRGQLIDVGAAAMNGYQAGAGLGRGLVDSVQGMIDKVSGAMSNIPDSPLAPGDPGLGDHGAKAFDPSMMGPVKVKGGKIDKVKEVDVNDEYIKLLKDVAEQKWQQNFITLRPEITNNVQVNNDQDQEDFVAKFNDQLLDAVDNRAASLLAF